jgi:hypothetical protein
LISDVSAGGPVQVKRSADLALEIRQQLQVWSCREFGLSVRIVIDDQNKEKSGATSWSAMSQRVGQFKWRDQLIWLWKFVSSCKFGRVENLDFRFGSSSTIKIKKSPVRQVVSGRVVGRWVVVSNQNNNNVWRKGWVQRQFVSGWVSSVVCFDFGLWQQQQQVVLTRSFSL